MLRCDLSKLDVILAKYNCKRDCITENRVLIRTKSGKKIWLSIAATMLDIVPDYVLEV